MSMYTNDPNNNQKQIPSKKPNGIHRFSHAINPAAQDVVKRPTYVNINKVGTYCFLYETTASVGGTTLKEGYITGSVVQNANAGGIKLDISPVAWQRIDAADAVGDVTFVYVRVR